MDPNLSDASSSKRLLEDGSSALPETKRLKTNIQDVETDRIHSSEKVDGDGGDSKGKKKRANTGPKNGRLDRRGTRGTRAIVKEHSPRETEQDTEGEKKARLPKRQCALLIGFCGTGCNGMQIQPNVRTIEGVLFDAMVKAGAVSQDNADDPVKVGLKRAARTDAGVHAAGNLISIKMITSVPGIPDMVARINQELPPEIRLWSFLRTQNSFNAHTSCDSRMYTYFLPSYVLLPPKPDSGLAKAFKANTEDVGAMGEHPFWRDRGDSTPQEDLLRKRTWRIDSECLASVRGAVARYLGTRNFHNFTIGRDFGDRSNHRFMRKIEVQDPAVYGDTEWIAILFHGQSFMLHQRKMVCALVLACRTGTPSKILVEMFGPCKVVVPKAPALGLLLEQPLFESYNKKVEEANARIPEGDNKAADSNFRPRIDFEPYRALIDQFKQDQIYSRMRTQEDEEATFDAWIRSIDAYAGNDLLYLNLKGIIPPAAVLAKGQPRSNPFRERKRFDAVDVSGRQTTRDSVDSEEEDEERVDKEKLKEMEG